MKKIWLTVLVLFFAAGSFLYPEIKQQLWGEIGYILDLDRIKEGSESALEGKSDNQEVAEIERWLANQNAYTSLYFSYGNILEAGSDFTLDLNNLASTSLPELVKVLYVSTSPTDWCNITFGKQRLKWGTARVFNAIDKLESLNDPFGLRTLREGVSGIKAVFTPVDWLSFSILGLPENELRWSRFAGRLDFLFLDIDAGIGVIKYNYSRLKSIDETSTPESAVTSRLDRYALFFDAIRYFGSLGLYVEFEYRYSGENAYAFKDLTAHYDSVSGDDLLNTPVIRLTCGLSYTLEQSPYFTVMAEYFFNSEGFTNAEAKKFYRSFGLHHTLYPDDPIFLSPNFGTFGNFRKHYFCLGITGLQATNFLSLGLLVLSNPETMAFNFMPQATVDINKTVYITVKYEYFYQFLDKDQYPSELNFIDFNSRITFSVSTNFSFMSLQNQEDTAAGSM
jgi:hypothetical protein